MPNLLDSLRRHTVIVADTGDLAAIGRLKPRDATTNPSLILKAAQTAAAEPLLRQALAAAAGEPVDRAIDRLLVAFGIEILKLIDGRVSTEVDAHQSFDTRATIERARRIVALYEATGVERQRVLIKIASTWEGIRAAEVLEREGIHCNLTLLFAMPQAEAAAAAGCDADLALRRTDLRLVQEGRRGRLGQPANAGATTPASLGDGRSTSA